MGNGGFDYNDQSDSDLSIVPGILLEQSRLVRGELAYFRISNAEPNRTVYFLFSLAGPGQGPIVNELGGLQLDLMGPFVYRTAIVNANGRALLTARIPQNAPIVDLIWTQAAIRRGVNGTASIKSEYVEAPLEG